MSVQAFGRWFATHVATPARISILSGCILLAGIFFEFKYPEWKVSAFSRSGSCLVVFAILCVFVNHSLEKIVANHQDLIAGWDSSEERLSKHFTDQITIQLQDRESRGTLPPGYMSEFPIGKYVSSGVQSVRQGVDIAKTENKTFSNARAVLSITEATAGIIGTLVWGFGDLLRPLVEILVWEEVGNFIISILC